MELVTIGDIKMNLHLPIDFKEYEIREIDVTLQTFDEMAESKNTNESLTVVITCSKCNQKLYNYFRTIFNTSKISTNLVISKADETFLNAKWNSIDSSI